MEHFDILNLSQANKIDFLDSFDIVKNLNTLQIDKLATFFKSYMIQPGITILKEGEKNSFFCLICEGQVDIIKSNNSEKAKKVNTLGTGKIIGEISFFDSETCSANVVANNKVTLLLMDRDSFKTLCEESAFIALQIALTFMKSISQRLRQTTGKLVDFL